MLETLVNVSHKKCLRCSNKFYNQNNKKFCSSACRFRAWYDKRYTHLPKPCVYCGLPAEAIDHVPPRAYRSFLESVGERRFPFVEVPACSECNCALGAKALWTISARKEYIKRWLERRYRRELAMPGWSVEEIRELGASLALDVVAGLARRDLARRRLRW